MKICPNCHKEFDDNHKFCGDCGIELINKKIFCPKCGKELNAGQTFCGECGTKISEDTLKNISEKARQIGETVRDKAADLVSQENLDKAANQINKIASTVKNSEFLANAKDNIQQGTENLSQSVKNFNTQDFSFDLIKMFPTSDSQYDAALKWMRLAFISLFILSNLITISGVEEAFLLYFLIYIPGIYIQIYILIKSGTLKYIAKIILGLFATLFICSLGRILSPDSVYMLMFFSVCFAIYVNKKRLAFVKNNVQYMLYPIGISIIMTVVGFLIFEISKDLVLELMTEPDSMKPVMIYLLKTNSLTVLLYLSLYYSMRHFMRQEQKRGVSFLEMNKRFFSVPLTLIFYLVSFLSISHFFDADSGSIINGDLADGNLSDGNLNSTEVAFADTSNHENVTSVSPEVNSNEQIITPVENNLINSTDNNSNPVTANEITEIPIKDNTNNPLQNSDFTVTDKIGHIVISNHENVTSVSPEVNSNEQIITPVENDLINSTDNNSNPVAANEITKIPIKDNTNNPLQNSDFTVTDKIGHTVMHFDSEHGVLYDGQGNMIAHLQGTKNDYLVTTEGKTIARYDSNMKILYDGFNQPLDVKLDGDTFQHIKDAKGNGTEIINGEIFDAKTHEKIGNLKN